MNKDNQLIFESYNKSQSKAKGKLLQIKKYVLENKEKLTADEITKLIEQVFKLIDNFAWYTTYWKIGHELVHSILKKLPQYLEYKNSHDYHKQKTYFRKIDFLYHATDLKNIPKILKEGIIPQLQTSGWDTDYKASFFTRTLGGAKDMFNQINNRYDRKDRKPTGKCVIKVDKSKIPNIKIYRDYNVRDLKASSFYTIETVPVEAIIQIIQWKDIFSGNKIIYNKKA